MMLIWIHLLGSLSNFKVRGEKMKSDGEILQRMFGFPDELHEGCLFPLAMISRMDLDAPPLLNCLCTFVPESYEYEEEEDGA